MISYVHRIDQARASARPIRNTGKDGSGAALRQHVGVVACVSGACEIGDSHEVSLSDMHARVLTRRCGAQ